MNIGVVLTSYQYLKKMDKINVIVPCYNYANYLDLCLMSIFTQRVNCVVEILFSNDNSTDESLGIAERIAARYNNDQIFMTVFNHEKNIFIPCHSRPYMEWL